MSVKDFLRSIRLNNVEKVEDNSSYNTDVVGNIQIPESLNESNAFTLANTVSEIYFPIDFLADRASKLRFYIADKSGNEVANTELNRFITDINPFFSFADLIYQYIFSYLSTGNAIKLIGVPTSFKEASISNITRLDILNPKNVTFYEYSNISLLSISSLKDMIRRAEYIEINGFRSVVDINRLSIDNIDMTRSEYSNVLSKSPLFKSYRNINNLLATYSARYNVYANNGAAGYLTRKSVNNNDSLTGAINSGKEKDQILKDINDRNGVTGRRNLWGISGVPLEFINTLVSIKDLLPFEETLENSIKIASTFQIPPDLVPRKDQSTFNNRDSAEKSVWENTLISLVDSVCDTLSKDFTLNKSGYSIKADYSTVSVLNANESVVEDNCTKKLDNLKKIIEIDPTRIGEVNKEIDKIITRYNS